jgi:hypothetical protein
VQAVLKGISTISGNRKRRIDELHWNSVARSLHALLIPTTGSQLCSNNPAGNLRKNGGNSVNEDTDFGTLLPNGGLTDEDVRTALCRSKDLGRMIAVHGCAVLRASIPKVFSVVQFLSSHRRR